MTIKHIEVNKTCLKLVSAQFSRSVMSNSLQPHGPQPTRPPCPWPTPGVHPNPCPLCPVIPSNHLILRHPLLLLPPIFPSIRVFSNESALHIRWPWLIYLFIMAVLDLGCTTQGLQCCLWAFSTRGEWELLSGLWYAGSSLQWLLLFHSAGPRARELQ